MGASLPAGGEVGSVGDGYKVDPYWPQLDFVIETDGGRFHRTAFTRRAMPGATKPTRSPTRPHLRFTHAQVWWERPYVQAAIANMAHRLGEARH